MTANPLVKIHDEVVLHRIALGRHSNAVVRRVVAQMDRIAQDVLARISLAEAAGKSTARLDALLLEVRSIQTEGWAVIRARLGADIEGIARAEIDFSDNVAQFARKAATGVDVAFTPKPALSQVLAAVQARPFQGKILREWMEGVEAGVQARVRETIRQGFVEGQTVADIVKRLRGTAANRYKDGVLEISRRSASTMVRTAIAHTASVAQEATYRANADVIEGVIWTSVLDSHTTPVCQARSEVVYPIDSGPRPPAHPNCRSTTRPKVASIPGIEDLKPQTYEQWLRRQSRGIQDEVLGPTRAKLWREGGISITQFVDKTGRELTLDQLRRRDASAFERAGL